MDEQTVQVTEQPAQFDHPIVGIGASAGGLEAVTTMFANIESGTGMAFVLVMHLDPHHESMMVVLLSSKTQVTVRQISDGDLVEPDCIHVIPPGSSLKIEIKQFRLEKFAEPRGLRKPIDSFFSSLAQVQGEMAACVILSGTGGDGTAGLRDIKEMGGISVVQSPVEARYDGMPSSAISTKLVDFTLPATDIVPRIKSFFDRAAKSRFPDNQVAAERVLRDILAILKSGVGIDFSGYKPTTLLRRLNRRLQLQDFNEVEKYIIKLAQDPEEQSGLAEDFLINVTSFFRDREHFENLRQTVLIPLIECCDASAEIRIWVPGCSSGQEAYTIAMLVDQTCLELSCRPLIQIFATDIDAPMIDHARRGSYPVSMMGEIPEAYRKTYTVEQEDYFEILPRLRDMVRFSIHNIVQDPPFSKIDLISCRNMLIYLGDELQDGVLPLMHSSLRPGGYLFLGPSESVTKRSELFIGVEQRACIFRRNDSAKRGPVSLPLGLSSTLSNMQRAVKRLPHEQDFPRHSDIETSNSTIYEHYAPPFIRVSQDGRILDSSGDLSLFMMSRPGADRNIDTLAREGVFEVIAPLLKDAAASNERQAMKDVVVSSQFGVQKTDIVAHPLGDETVAIIFLSRDRLRPVVDQFAVRPITRDRQIAILQDELQKMRLQLKAKVEEIETANEELKSSNEEMMSMNEELQSANEELTTANEELKNKIDELTLANADLDNFLQSSDLAMIVLDKNLRIRHVTDAVRRLVPLMRSDEGRILGEFNLPIGKIDLMAEARKVIDGGTSFSITTDQNQDGQSFFLRITPYFFNDGAVEGVSVTLINISNELELRQDLSAQGEKLKLAMQAAQMGSWDTDIETGRMEIDALAAKISGLPNAGVYHGSEFFQNLRPENEEEFAKLRDAALAANSGYSYKARLTKDGEEPTWIQVHAKPYVAADGRRRIAGLGIDVTEVMKLQRALELETTRRSLAMRAARMGMAELDIEGELVTVDQVLAEHLVLGEAGTMPLRSFSKSLVKEDASLFDANLKRAIEHDEEYEFDFRVDGPNGDRRWVRTRGLP